MTKSHTQELSVDVTGKIFSRSSAMQLYTTDDVAYNKKFFSRSLVCECLTCYASYFCGRI